MIEITEEWRELINNSFADRAFCLIATAGRDGRPNISTKGSMCVYDSETLAFWERSKRTTLDNLRENPHAIVWYSNRTKAEHLPRGATLRFHGRAEIHEDGPVREKVKAMIVKAELDRDPEDKGAAVLIRVDKIDGLAGPLQDRDGA